MPNRRAIRSVQLSLSSYCANPMQSYPCFSEPKFAQPNNKFSVFADKPGLEIQVMFLTKTVRTKHGHGNVHYIPQHLSRWVENIIRFRDEDDTPADKTNCVDIFWGSCTPPDDRGFVSLGPGSCYEPEILRAANCVILEVNPNLPYTYGSTHVPVSWVNHFIMSEHQLGTIAKVEPNSKDLQIAEQIADLIVDGATLQLGIGGIPNAVGKSLRHKRDLGIHTEMINDAIMELYQDGVITGRYKTIWPGKIIGSFVLGTNELYKFCDHNSLVELHPASIVNDTYRIGRNYKMVSINTAVEVDLTGQVCSESLGHLQLSGVGGATDTHVGAQRSKDGRGIIALHSTTSDEKISKIVFELRPGAKVSISRNDVDTIVTEYGSVRLRGKSVAQRVKALVSIAHPKFRDELLDNALRAGYI